MLLFELPYGAFGTLEQDVNHPKFGKHLKGSKFCKFSLEANGSIKVKFPRRRDYDYLPSDTKVTELAQRQYYHV
jgi:hypothetical protein